MSRNLLHACGVRPFFVAMIAVFIVFATTSSCTAEDRLSSSRALQLIAKKFGTEWLTAIVEMRGDDAQPQPEEWRIVVRDPSSPTTLREFWAGSGYATNEGAYYKFFPERVPGGYIRRGFITVGSKRAFSIAEGAARLAKVGFDSLAYRLSYVSGAQWEVTLRNDNSEVVGKVFVSAVSGDIRRTVWMRRAGSGRLFVEDSALAGE